MRLINGDSGHIEIAALVQGQLSWTHRASLHLTDDYTVRLIVTDDALGDQEVIDTVITQLSLDTLFLVKSRMRNVGCVFGSLRFITLDIGVRHQLNSGRNVALLFGRSTARASLLPAATTTTLTLKLHWHVLDFDRSFFITLQVDQY